jgi:copper chaperone CopZ
MESATMSTRTLEIDGMSAEECVQKVTGALKGVRDVTIQSVKIGEATIGADQVGSDAACAAIERAGFNAREGACNNGAKNSSCCGTSATPSGLKGGDQSCTPIQNQAKNGSGAANSGCGTNGANNANVKAPASSIATKI